MIVEVLFRRTFELQIRASKLRIFVFHASSWFIMCKIFKLSNTFNNYITIKFHRPPASRRLTSPQHAIAALGMFYVILYYSKTHKQIYKWDINYFFQRADNRGNAHWSQVIYCERRSVTIYFIIDSRTNKQHLRHISKPVKALGRKA